MAPPLILGKVRAPEGRCSLCARWHRHTRGCGTWRAGAGVVCCSAIWPTRPRPPEPAAAAAAVPRGALPAWACGSLSPPAPPSAAVGQEPARVLPLPCPGLGWCSEGSRALEAADAGKETLGRKGRSRLLRLWGGTGTGAGCPRHGHRAQAVCSTGTGAGCPGHRAQAQGNGAVMNRSSGAVSTHTCPLQTPGPEN